MRLRGSKASSGGLTQFSADMHEVEQSSVIGGKLQQIRSNHPRSTYDQTLPGGPHCHSILEDSPFESLCNITDVCIAFCRS
mmetsp:Transcript_580/g.982  ORF Transcript_580/g.982 Transcript_580/m.982 type:complete len:81 (+) Transcript_580:52-294(+)